MPVRECRIQLQNLNRSGEFYFRPQLPEIEFHRILMNAFEKLLRRLPLLLLLLALSTGAPVPSLNAQNPGGGKEEEQDEPQQITEQYSDRSNIKEATKVFRMNHETQRIESENNPVHLTKVDLQGPISDLANQTSERVFAKIKQNVDTLIKAAVKEIETGKDMIRQQVKHRFESIRASFQDRPRSVTRNMDEGQCGEVRQKFWIEVKILEFGFTFDWEWVNKEAGTIIVNNFAVTNADSMTAIRHRDPELFPQPCAREKGESQ